MKKKLVLVCVSVSLSLSATLAQAAFEVFYDDQDASTIAGAINRSDLTNAERQTAQKIWNGGFKSWSTAPFFLSPTCDDPTTFPVTSHGVVISGVTKQDMVTMLNSIGTRLGPGVGGYLTTLALDVAQCSVEPV